MQLKVRPEFLTDSIMLMKGAFEEADALINFSKEKEWEVMKSYEGLERETDAGKYKGPEQEGYKISLDAKEDVEAAAWDNKLFDFYQACITQYVANNNFICITKDEGYVLMRYSEGSGHLEHADNLREGTFGRLLTGLICLSSDYKGGELILPRQNLNIRLEKGDALFFPSSFVCPHKVEKITKGQRYMVRTWFWRK